MLYGIEAGCGVRGAHLGSEGELADVFHADMLESRRDRFRT